MIDDSFDFGFNVDTPLEGEHTAVVTESELITWRDIELARRTARADVETIANSRWTRALSYVARIKTPALRLWAGRWLTYCTAPGHARPVRHAGEAGRACRRVELELSRLGVDDETRREMMTAYEKNRESFARSKGRDSKPFYTAEQWAGSEAL